MASRSGSESASEQSGAQAQAPSPTTGLGSETMLQAPSAVEAGLTEVGAFGLESAEATWERG